MVSRRSIVALALLSVPTLVAFHNGGAFAPRLTHISASSAMRLRRAKPSRQLHMHGHHGSHGHRGNHGHQGAGATALALDITPPPTRATTVLRITLAAITVLALPLWRRTSRVEVGLVGLLATFLAAVDAGKIVVKRLRLHPLYLSWRSHSKAVEGTERSKKAAMEQDAVTWAGVFINVGLAGFKFFAGVTGHSAAMIADAGHSLSDLLSDGVTLWAVRMARLPPDDDHPYGHGRFEALGAFLIGLMLLGTGYGIGNLTYESLAQLVAAGAAYGAGPSAQAAAAAAQSVPTRIAMVAAAISIASKEALFQVTVRVGNRLNSQVLIANAWHHRSDAVSSVVALVAIAGAMAGVPVLDPLAGLMVAGMVSLSGLQVCLDATRQLTDTVDYDMRREVAEVARTVDGVVSFDRIRARQMGPQTLVDLTVQTDNMLSASAAQQVAQRVRWQILERLPVVSDVLVNIAVEEKPCPVMSTLRTVGEIEADVRDVLRKAVPEIAEVPRVLVHYISMTVKCDVFVRVNPRLRVHEAMDVGRRAKKALRAGVKDLCTADVHLDLVETY